MNISAFNNYTFQQALARARAREAIEISEATAGRGQQPSCDISELLRRKQEENLRRALAMAFRD